MIGVCDRHVEDRFRLNPVNSANSFIPFIDLFPRAGSGVLRIELNSVSAGAPPQTRLGKLTALPQTHPGRRKGSWLRTKLAA